MNGKYTALINGQLVDFPTRTAKRKAQQAAGCVGEKNPLHVAQNTSKTAQHTPGPWSQECPPSSCLTDRWITSGDGTIIAEVNNSRAMGNGRSNEREVSIFENAANARLIAAAPELLAALKGLLRVADNHNKLVYGKNSNSRSLWKEQVDAIAAIAKAEGKL